MEQWIARHRGIWILMLCAVMVWGGNAGMEKKVVETGNTILADSQAKFTGLFSENGGEVGRVLESLKPYHPVFQMEIDRAEEEQAEHWFLEYGE